MSQFCMFVILKLFADVGRGVCRSPFISVFAIDQVSHFHNILKETEFTVEAAAELFIEYSDDNAQCFAESAARPRSSQSATTI